MRLNIKNILLLFVLHILRFRPVQMLYGTFIPAKQNANKEFLFMQKNCF